MNNGIMDFLRTIPPGTMVDIQQQGHPMMFGVVFQGVRRGIAQFTNWPWTVDEKIVRIALPTIVVIGLSPRATSGLRLLSLS